MELELRNISKQYSKGKVWALKDVSMHLTPGVYGLLGPNGAGKSTLMNIITDNLKPDQGDILYDGEHIHTMGKRYREKIGYMPQQQGIYDEFSAKQFLYYMASLKGLKKTEAKKQIEEHIELVNLQDQMYKKLKGFSGGMKQRILIAQALLGNPEILILDEPTAGLDPKERIRIRNFISKIGKDRIVLLASHVVPDIEFISKEIIVLKKGMIIQQDTSSNLLKHVENKVFEIIVNEEELDKVQQEFKISNLYRQDDKVVVRIVGPETIDNCTGKKVIPNLEDLYLELFE